MTTYSFAGLMSRRLPNGTSDLIVLHGIRETDIGQGEAVRRYIKQSLTDNPGYVMCTSVSVLEVEVEQVREEAA
jgi:hypothetical protein